MNELQVVGLAIAGAIWFLIAQHVALRKAEGAAETLLNTIHGIAEGKLEVKIDTDGDIAIRKPRS